MAHLLVVGDGKPHSTPECGLTGHLSLLEERERVYVYVYYAVCMLAHLQIMESLIETINLCDASDDSDDADPPAQAERALRSNRRQVYRQGHYGSSDREIYDYLQNCAFGQDVQLLDPLIITIHERRPNVRPPNHHGQVLLVCRPRRRSHWCALCFDFVFNIFGSVGAGHIHPDIAEYLNAHQIDIGQFQDITPAVGHQVESECGARAAIYCHWFGIVRTRSSINRRHINVPQFQADVAALMAAWRAVR